MTGSAINNAATANRNAQVIAGSSVGGNTGVTTGGQKQLQSSIAANVGSNLATNENQINLANAELGRQNFFSAEQGLGGVAGLYSPTSYAGAATNAGSAAASDLTAISKEKNQVWSDLGGVVSGLGGVALNNWMKSNKNSGNNNSSGGGSGQNDASDLGYG